jgi:hypothetical protein
VRGAAKTAPPIDAPRVRLTIEPDAKRALYL